MNKKWDFDDPILQRTCTDEVIARIDDIDGSSAGVIAAQEIIDIVAEHLGPVIYNKGVNDARKIVAEKLADIEVDIATLEHRT